MVSGSRRSSNIHTGQRGPTTICDHPCPALNCSFFFLPALRVAENYSKNTAVAAAGLIKQYRAVQLAQFPRDEKSQSRAPFSTGKERLEDAIHQPGFDSLSVIQYFQERPIVRIQATDIYLNADPVARFAVFHGVVAQIPHHLVQMAG